MSGNDTTGIRNFFGGKGGSWLKGAKYLLVTNRPPQIAASARLSNRHGVPKFENDRHFEKKAIKGRYLTGTKLICGSLVTNFYF